MARLIRFDEEERVERGDGIETVRLSRTLLDGQEFQIGITTFPPGTGLRPHSHNTIEQVTVIEGEGQAELDGALVPVRPYDATQVPAGQVHRFVNTGTTTMRILWVYGGAYVTRTFADTGETVDQFPDD